jgi:hypothetical protein
VAKFHYFILSTIWKKDDESRISVKIILIKLSSNNRFAESYSLIWVDQTQEIRQNERINPTKRQYEIASAHLFPQDIITRMKNEEKDISFSVSKVTIIFINIVKFSAYLETLPDGKVMIYNLIFTEDDQIL